MRPNRSTLRLTLTLAAAWMAMPAALAQTAPTSPPTPPPAPAPAPAAPQASPGLTARIAQLPALIGGSGDFDGSFSAAFRAQVKQAQFAAIGTQLVAQHGAVGTVEQVVVASPNSATVKLGFERAVATVQISVDPAAPHVITGLLINQLTPRRDDIAKITADLRALPGTTGFAVHALGDAVTPVHQDRGDQLMPLGSSFKLWVLAEAARQVAGGKRKWSDVVRLGPNRSLPSGMMQHWPKDAPVTLQTLATMMITVSDNSATDALMETLGRGAVDAMVARSGMRNPDATLPLLTTREAFQLKTPSNADLVAGWKAAGSDGRRKLMRDNQARLNATKLDASQFSAAPSALDIEWFSTPADQAALLNWLRQHGGQTALDIMAINPGVPGAAQFDYLGFKGGSEPGVIHGSWLVKTKKGNWYAVSGGWTRPDAGVETNSFIAVMGRLVQQLADK